VIQSQRIEAHRAAITQLLESGQAYRCYATEAELAAMRERQQAIGPGSPLRQPAPGSDAAQERAFIAEGREAVVRFRIDDGARFGWSDLVRGSMRWSRQRPGG
jgi:glutamyl-tRNA synthetase